MTHRARLTSFLVLAAFVLGPTLTMQAAESPTPSPSADEVLQGFRRFFAKTARADGSFQNGIDPNYRGMSDSAYSDLAAVTYAVTRSARHL